MEKTKYKRKCGIFFIIMAALLQASCGNMKKQDNEVVNGGSIFVGTTILREADRIKTQEETEEKTASDETAPKPTATPEPTLQPTTTPEPTPKPTATPEPTPQPTATPEPTPEPTATPEPPPEPTATPEPTPEPTATPEPTPQPTPQPTATPESTPASTHQHIWEQKEVQPNCFRNGARWEVCLECGAVQNEIQLPKTDHIEGDSGRCVNCGTLMRPSTE